MKKHLLLNQSFGTEGNPNQTGETLTPSDERAMTERKPRGEKEQLSSTCLRSASELPPFRSRYLRYAAMIFAVLVMSIGQMWGDTYTWSFASGSGTLNNNTTNFTSTSGSKTLSYKGGSSNDGWDGTPKYLKMGGKSTFSSGTYSDRYFTFKAPSASGKISIAFAGTANNADITTSLTGYPLVRATIVGAASSTVTSDIITGLTAGTTDIYIIFPGDKAYIYSITWTDATLSANNELYSSDYKSTMESGGTYSGSSGSIITSSLPSDKGSYTSAFKTTSSSGYATVSFASALSLNSDGNDRGYIEIEYSHSGAYGFALSINGGSSVASYVLKKGGQGIHTARYTIPTGVTSISSITATGSGSTGLYLFHVKVVTHSAASSCTGAWSFHSKNSSSEWRDPICMELEGDGDFYISEETAINVGDVSYKVGHEGVDEAKTIETDWQWMPMGPARNWTVGAHPTASNAGGALGYFYIHSSYTDNNRYIGFFPSSYMLRQGSGDSWSNTTFNPASSAYGETVWTTTVQKFTASNAADYMYTALGTGNGGAVGCAMSTAMRPIFLKLHSDWKASSPKFYIYYFKNGTDKNGWSGLMQAVSGTGGDDLVGWIPEGDWDRVQFVRFNPGDAVASWKGNVWNSTYAITLDSEKNYYVLEAQGNGGALDWYGHWDLYHNGFYRIWVDNASTNFALHYVPQYVLEYDNNGGSGSIDPQSVALDADPNTVTVKAVTGFTAPTGKHFVNWNTAPGGGGTSYAPSDSYSLTANGTLYAQWANNQYSVTHSGSNRGVTSGVTGANAATYGTDYTAEFSETTGYNLPATITVTIGGNTTTQGTEYTWDQGTGTVVVEGDYILGDVVITVNGVLKTYTVNFASNNVSYGAVSSSSISSVPHGSTVSINGSTNALTLNGSTITVSPTTSTAAYTYAFDHWSVDNGDEITGTTTITATFTRTAKTYDVDVTLTDSKTTKKSGTTGSNAATFGTNHTLEFEAVSGYELPNDVTVIIGSDEVTKDVAYTWSVSEGVGTLQIGGSYILGNIAITVTATSTCSTPADPDGLAAGSISSSDVTFTITDDESPASYDIYYSTSSTAPTGSTEASTTATSKTPTVSGLTASTTYYAWVRSVCDEDNKSDWVALTGSTFTTSAAPATYYLFTPTNASVSMAHTGTLSGVFYTGQSVSNQSGTISTIEYSKGIKFGGQLSSLGYTNAYFLKYDVRSTKSVFTVAATGGSFIVYQVSDGGTSTSTTYDVTSATTNTTFTITSSAIKTIYIGATGGNTNVKILQIKVEESGTIYKRAGEIGYSVSFVDGRLGGANGNDVPLDGMTIHQAQNYTPASSDDIKLSTNNTDYISFTTTAACQLSVTTNASSKAYYVASAKNGTTNETSATGTSTFNLAAGTWYINPKTSSVYVTALSFSAAASTYTVSVAANPSDYGSVSASSVSSVASGTTLSTSTNTLSVGATNVTATAKSATAEYTYSFNNWTKNDGTALPSTVTADLSVYANFTRTANSYTLAWNTNGGSDLSGSYTSGSTAYGASITAPNDPTLSNYTFDGWKTNNDGTGTTAGATMPAANTTYYAAWKQTVTLTTGAQGSGDNQTPVVYLNGTSVSDFTAHTASGYTLQGYYTAGSGGVKVLNADGSFAAANVTDYITSSKWSRTGAAPTLYAQWVASEDCSTSDFVIQKGSSEQYQGCMESSSYNGTATSFTAGSPTTVGNAKMTISNYDGGIKRPGSDNTFSIVIEPVSGYYLKSICWAGKVESGETVSYYWDDNSGSPTTITPQTTSGTGVTYNAPSSTTKFTASYVDDGVDGGGIWWRNVQVEVCAAGVTTYSVTYDGNDETGGTAPTDASSPYDYGATVTVLGNTGSLAKTNYSFAGWTTNNNGTGSSYEAGSTFSITANTTLYAKWTQSVTLDKNGGSTDGSATAVWNATGLTGITHAKPAAGYKLLGYYSASSDGTKVLNSDGSFAATNVTGYITSGKWSRTSATTLYAEYESAGALTWNLIVNSDTANLSTSTKTSAFTEISTANMSNATVNGLTYKGDAKASLTGKISTPAHDADKYVKVTFQVASGYKFIPSLISVPIQPVGDGEHKAVELSLTDTESHSLVSGSATKCDGTVKGKKTTVTLAGDGTYFKGTVTLKIYVYPHTEATAAENNCYRLGTPITIEGEIEEACATMPSYKSMSYTTTTFAPGEDASGSPITIVGGDNINTYQWKYNTVNDRTSGTNCGTGTSLTPLTDAGAAIDVTRYYWCEMTNDACGITIKSPAVAITVASAKSDASVTWTDPATPNYGGGGYTIKATVNETGWDGNEADLVITAPAGINIYNVTSGTTSSQKWVQADFDVQTSFDRTTYASNIPFTVSAAATASYNAISDDHNVSYSACSGGGGGSSYKIRVRKSYDKDASNNYRWVTPGAGEITYAVGSSISSGKAGTAMATDFDSIMSSDKQYIWVKTFVGNIKQMRLYVETSGANVSVSALYQRTTYAAADAKDVITGYSVVYDEDDDAENTGTKGQHTIDLIFTSALSANDIICVKFSSSKVKALGAAITEGSAGSLNTYLQWSGELENGATVAKNTTDAYFTYSASKITENTNTLGAITYSSSNTSVATVDATGKVALIAAGSTTIKATLAASGCYKKTEISYTLNVTEVACAITAGTLTLTSGTESKCSSADVTLTLTGFESDAAIQWKDGDTNIDNGGNYTIATDGTTSTLTTNQPGTYSVMVTKDCSVRSNRITISNKSTEVGAKRIVKNWYIKNGRLTPDIELWTLQNGAHLSSVAWSPDNTTGLTASDFYESDGKVYLKGKEPSSNTSGKDIDYTLTLTVEDDCGSTTPMSASGQLIYLHHQKNTDKHVLAFVVTGTEKGGFTEGITADQTTSVELYNTIAANFDVLATNVYSTDDEQALKEYYSQFDILCVTDYPNTGTKGVNKKSYVDALGALVDIRPILTMEAFVAKLANWKAKGISGTPQSPTTRQYTMLLQCKDHEIFSGTELTKVGEGDETMYRVSMVDNTQEEYVSLDATYGEGAHAEKSGYNYGGKPALQGFTFTKEMLDNDLLPLGLIDDGSGNDLQVGIERQTEMEARLMVLGINSYAMERLTDDGQTVVVNALKYLMKKNSEDIADCSNTFVGGDDEEDESTRDNWDVASHWSGNAVPDRTQKVRIVAPCVIPANVKPHVTGVIIAPSGKYNHGANTANGSLTIAAGGALIVDGKVEAATAPLYTETRATTPTDLYIAADETKGNGTLIFDNEDGETQATVGYYSKATTDENTTWNWQYMAVPFNDNSSAYRNYYDSYLYRWAEDCSGWEVVPNRGEVYPWVGYCITQVGEKTYYMDGTLVETGEQVFTVPGGKDLVLGNSWSAPIQVKQLTDDDFVNLRKNVYLFNTGYDPNSEGEFDKDEGRYAPGTYVTIPIHSATYTGDSMVSSLQAFIVYTDGALDGTLTLDYDRHVRPARSTDIVNAGPMHAPRRGASISEEPAVLKIYASGSRYDDRLVVLERGDFSTGLDDGWDGDKRLSGNVSPHLYAETDNGKESVSAIPDMEGTLLGFRAGEDNEYTLHFYYSEDEALYLLDMENNIYTPVNNESSYTFVTSDKSEHTRFILTRTAPGIATGVTDLDAAAPKVQKIIYNDKLYIIRGGKVYSADGQVVK